MYLATNPLKVIFMRDLETVHSNQVYGKHGPECHIKPTFQKTVHVCTATIFKNMDIAYAMCSITEKTR